MRRPAYGDERENNEFEYFYGEAGNDVIRGSHKAKWSRLQGGDGHDKVYGGDGHGGGDDYLLGNDGDDWIKGGDYSASLQELHGDSIEYYGDEYNDTGDDLIYGGNNGMSGQLITGGYGSDKIFSGAGIVGDYGSGTNKIEVWGDYKNSNYRYRGSEDGKDGDDVIDIGDSPDLADVDSTSQIIVYGQGGNDKILGSLGSKETIWGGDGDDKIWAENPGQTETISDINILHGGNGADIIYGSAKADKLYGDWKRDSDDTGINSSYQSFDLEGGDDIIYTGVGDVEGEEGDHVHGGFGDDKIYGQGKANHTLYGEYGDDHIWGGLGDDVIWGDDANDVLLFANSTDPVGLRWSSLDQGIMSGDDTLHGGEGDDYVFGGAGDDYLYGEDGDDQLVGGGGEDTLWGGDGDDYIYTGTGWDTVFGGNGCDYIFS